MKKIISKLRKDAGQPQPAASPSEVSMLEAGLGVTLPEELKALYADHNGAAAPGNLPWRLLSTAEVLQVNSGLSAEGLLPAPVKLFWGDDEGNYAGCYFAGPQEGQLCFFEHEERDFAPRFTGLGAFLRALAAAAGGNISALEMPGDVPSTASPERVRGMLGKLSDEFRKATDSKKRRQLAWDIIAQTPPERTAELLGFLDDPDLLVQERAAEALGKRRYEPAIPRLMEVAKRDSTNVHNAKIGSILALGRMRTAAGLHSLMDLSKTIPNGFHSYIYKALELHGCTIQFDAGRWKYRLPRSQEWLSLQ